MQPVVSDSAPFAEWSEDFHLVLGDFNSDGRDDLLWHRTGKGLRNIAWIGFSSADATLRFSGPVTLGGDGQRWASAWEVYVGDLDNDGCDDLLFNFRNDGNKTWALRSLRYGTFALTGPMVHSAKGWGGYRAFLADVDGDKRADIVWNDVPVWSNRTYVGRFRSDGFDFLQQQDHTASEGWSRVSDIGLRLRWRRHQRPAVDSHRRRIRSRSTFGGASPRRCSTFSRCSTCASRQART